VLDFASLASCNVFRCKGFRYKGLPAGTTSGVFLIDGFCPWGKHRLY